MMRTARALLLTTTCVAGSTGCSSGAIAREPSSASVSHSSLAKSPAPSPSPSLPPDLKDVPLAEVDPLPRGDVTFRDTSGVQLGSIDLDGDVFDSAHTLVGHLDVDGTVRTASYSLLGTAASDGTFVDAASTPLAHIDDDGTIRSASFASIGHIDDDGTVRDVTTKAVAKVEHYSRALRIEVAAFVVFFASKTVVLQQK